MNESGKPADAKYPGYFPGLYRIDGNNRLHLYLVSNEGKKKLLDAVQSHHLAGIVTAESTGTDEKGKAIQNFDIRITADPKSLDAYFAANALLIFTEPLYTFERVK